jgi:hypothetical protein
VLGDERRLHRVRVGRNGSRAEGGHGLVIGGNG